MNLNSITHVINNLSNTMNGVIMRMNDIDNRIRDLSNQGTNANTTSTTTASAPGPDMKKYVDDQIAVVKQQMQRLDENVQQTNKQIGSIVSNAAAMSTGSTNATNTLEPLPLDEPVGADIGTSSLSGADVLGELNAAACDDAGDFTIETTKKKGGRKASKK